MFLVICKSSGHHGHMLRSGTTATSLQCHTYVKICKPPPTHPPTHTTNQPPTNHQTYPPTHLPTYPLPTNNQPTNQPNKQTTKQPNNHTTTQPHKNNHKNKNCGQNTLTRDFFSTLSSLCTHHIVAQGAARRVCIKHVHPHVTICLSVCCLLVLSSSFVSRASTFSHFYLFSVPNFNSHNVENAEH